MDRAQRTAMLMAAACVWAGCSPTSKAADAPVGASTFDPPPPASTMVVPTRPTLSATPVPMPALPSVTLSAGVPADGPSTMPSIALKSPTPGQVIPVDMVDDFKVRMEVKDWETREGGNQVHVIVDDKPYKAVYDTKASIRLGDLSPGGEKFSEGEHLLIAFPSRASHESVKPDKGKLPFAVVQFFVGKRVPSINPKGPMLIFSRPKGTYNGVASASRVLVDWYLLNAKLGESEMQIQLEVSGPGVDQSKFSIAQWKPYFLDNLRSGDYQVSAQLLGKDGKPLDGPLTKASRVITVNREAPGGD